MSSIPIILDTNVCLDLFVFNDKYCKELWEIIQKGIVKVVTRYDCKNEWLRVLNYPSLALNESVRQECITQYNNMVFCGDFPKRNYALLPICKDEDDQKFLELAYDSNAKFLITKDKALLKLSKKTRAANLFHIIKPTQTNLISFFINSST